MNPLTEDEFVRKFEAMLAGGLLIGVVSDLKDGPMQRGSKALEIPDEARRVLRMLFKAAVHGREEAKPLPVKNETPMPGSLKMPTNGQKRA